MADATLQVTAGKATIVASTSVPHRMEEPRLYNLTGPVRDSGGCILCFVGPPFKTLEWRMLQGEGTLTPLTVLMGVDRPGMSYTDKLGRAACRFDAVGLTGTAIVGVAWVP